MIVADTHALICRATASGGKLTRTAARAAAREVAEGEILVSSISAREMAMLVGHGRLVLSMPLSHWLQTVEQVSAVRFVPVDNAIALESVNLPGTLHKDPADRIIVATARTLGAPVATSDSKIRNYPHV